MDKPNPKPDAFTELIAIMARLRSDTGCPWDREQSHHTLKPYLIEEVYEFIDAVDANDDDAMVDELGDILLQVFFHCQIASETNRFTAHDAANGICRKLVRRHPHVFGDATAADAAAVLERWEEIKKTERVGRERESILDGVPRHLPSLSQAQKLQRKAATVGFDWSAIEDVVATVEEELAEVIDASKNGEQADVAEELGDLLFSVVNLCRFHGVAAEDALRATNAKFVRRFKYIERAVRGAGSSVDECDLATLEGYWNAAKSSE